MIRSYTYNRKENSKKSWFTLSRKTVTKCGISKIIYFSYIHSYLNYTNVAWDSTYYTKLKTIHH